MPTALTVLLARLRFRSSQGYRAAAYDAQRGNVFFVILLGIVLFAAVSMAIMQNSGGSQNTKNERNGLVAQQVLRYATEVKKAVDLLYQNGVSEADIRFASPQLAADYGDITVNSTNQVFAENGGGLSYAVPPSGAQSTATTWEFFGSSDIPQVGTSAADLVVVLPNIKVNVCKKINELVGYSSTANIPVDNAADGKCVYSATASDRFAGTFKTGGNVNSMGTTDFAVLPAYEACVSCSGTYYYYKVLIER